MKLRKSGRVRWLTFRVKLILINLKVWRENGRILYFEKAAGIDILFIDECRRNLGEDQMKVEITKFGDVAQSHARIRPVWTAGG